MLEKCETIINIKAAKNKELGVLGIAIWETQSGKTKQNKIFQEREKSQGLKKAKILYRVVKVSRIMIGSDTKRKYFLKG